MIEILQNHPEILTIATLGTAGFRQINKSSRSYQKGDFRKGSSQLLAGTLTLNMLAALNEIITSGEIGNYSGSQAPYVLSGLAEFFRHHSDLSDSQWFQTCVKATEKYTVLPAIALNIAIRIWLFRKGFIDPSSVLDWLRSFAFAGRSVSYVMPVEGDALIFRGFTAKQERFSVMFMTRAALTLTLSVDVIKSGCHVAASLNFGDANLLALLWLLLNITAIKQDFRSLDAEVDNSITNKIKYFGGLVRNKLKSTLDNL